MGYQWTKLLGLGLVICAMLPSVTSSNRCGVTFVLLGSTGSLARLYLWPALFRWHSTVLQTRTPECEPVIFGASRKPFGNEEEAWREITSNVNCEGVDNCVEALSHFKRASHFIKVKSQHDYTILKKEIQAIYFANELKEIGRVFYLAIPPSGYQEVSQNIHQYARPEAGAWLRVVLEKPFGHDLVSAKLLADKISEYLREDEIYRVDHYLGKFGVEQILPFRLENDAFLSPLWNKDAIQYVQVALKEHVDVRGRTKFYDSYGVIRDVLQNHLTEILTRLLVPMHSTDSLAFEHFRKMKKEILSKTYPPMLRHSLLGQYADYHQHLLDDGVLQQKGCGNSSQSLTPTFASVALYLRDPQWYGVPFILMSGKQLDQRTAYAHVVFKQRRFDVGRVSSNSSQCLPEIIFLIQDEQFPDPGILISEQLSMMEFTYPSNTESFSWRHEVTTYPSRGSGIDCKYSYIHPSRAVESNAYVSVIKAVLEGRQDLFVDTESLLLSWELWSPLLDEIELSKCSIKLHPYSPNLLDVLKFELQGSDVLPIGGSVSPVMVGVNHDTISSIGFESNVSTLWSRLLGQKTTISHKYALSILVAQELLSAARIAIENRGEFHLALPGGKSPVQLLNLLSLNYSFPWQQTHIWQTDERCVKRTSEDSNWKQISDYLLSIVPIPFHHLHPMPIDLQNGICNSFDHGDDLYHKTLDEFLSDGKLDYVVLGVGADGHIASLFPEASTIATSVSNGFVKVVELKESRIRRRMTLSYDAIRNARSIAVIVTGSEKRSLWDRQRVADCLKLEQLCDIPLLRLIRSALHDRFSLYIDSAIIM